MKCLTLIVHKESEDDLLDNLLSSPHVTGFSTTRCHGHSDRTRANPFETSRDRVLGFVPRLRVDVLLEDDAVTSVLAGLRRCDSCVTGMGVWWVTPVEASGHL